MKPSYAFLWERADVPLTYQATRLFMRRVPQVIVTRSLDLGVTTSGGASSFYHGMHHIFIYPGSSS